MERKTERGKQRYRWRELQRGTLRGETEAEGRERAQRWAKREGGGMVSLTPWDPGIFLKSNPNTNFSIT